MRILLLSSRFPPDIAGGGEILAGDVASELRHRGHEIWVLTSRSQAADGSSDQWVLRSLREAVDTNHVRRGIAGGRSARVVAFYRQAHARSSARRLLRAVAEIQPDLLYVWDLAGIGLTSVLRALRRVDVPIVFHLQNYWWQYINWPQTRFTTTHAVGLKRLLIGPVPPLRFTTSIAISETVKRAYVGAGCPEERIEVIDNAVGSRFLRPRDPAARAERCCTLTYAGRLCAEKGVMVALEAVDVLVRHHREVHLHIYGWGDAQNVDELTTFVRQRGLDNVVTFHGAVSRDELIRAYDRTDIVLVPSRWEEPFGLVAIEAMARGVPVIASDVGCLRDVIEHGTNGLLVKAADAQELAAAITQLADHPEEARRLGAAGRELVLRRYTLDVCTERIERHLEKARGQEVQESRWMSCAS
jgi:glycosyltransferase involved in cell wall biosynthesis